MPFLIMGAVTMAAIVTGRGTGVLPLMSLGPAFAAATGGLAYMLVTGGVAIALCAVLATYPTVLTTRQDILAFTTVAGVTVAGVIASAVRSRREQELADVTAIAEATQQVLLRPVPQHVGAVRLAVRYVSAASGARIGGDLYEAVPTDAGLRLIIGDVLGKGLPAVQTAATVLGAFREAAYDAPSLAVIADRIEASLDRQATGEQFVTAVLAQVCADGSEIELLNCGHPPPLLLSRGAARLAEPAQTALPLGLSTLADVPRERSTVGFGPGDCMLFYTDGITEARDKSGAFFPLATSGAIQGFQDPEGFLDQLSEEVVHHVGHALDDDAAMLLLHRDPGSADQPLARRDPDLAHQHERASASRAGHDPAAVPNDASAPAPTPKPSAPPGREPSAPGHTPGPPPGNDPAPPPNHASTPAPTRESARKRESAPTRESAPNGGSAALPGRGRAAAPNGDSPARSDRDSGADHDSAARPGPGRA